MGVHQATITNNFNRTTRTGRLLTSEETYGNGMNYTDNVLPEGYSKLLVNYKINDDGTSLSPRDGYHTYADEIYDTDVEVDIQAPTYTQSQLHWSGTMTYIDESDVDNPVNYLTKACVSFGLPHVDTAGSDHYFEANTNEANSNAYCLYSNPMEDLNPLLETGDDWIFTKGINKTQIRFKARKVNTSLVEFNDGVDILKPICTSCNGHLFVFAKCYRYNDETGQWKWDEEYSMTRVDIVKRSFEPELKLTTLDPYQETPKSLSTYGANLLSSNPYSFYNQDGSVLNGIGMMAYTQADETDTNYSRPILYANMGDTYRIRAFINYDSGSSYKIQWFLRDKIDSKGEDKKYIIKDWTDLGTITASTDIHLDYMYNDPNTVLYCGIKDADDDETYIEMEYIFKLNNGYRQLPDNYDLTTATNMLTYHQWIVLWGVTGAENTLFGSYADMPNRFPAGNMCVFDEPIVAVTNYLDNLIVFTTNKTYIVFTTKDGGTILFSTATTQTVSESIGMLPMDAYTLVAVSNLIFFRSKDHYYIVTPVIKSGTTTFKIVPCDSSIKDILNRERLDIFIRDLLFKMYDITIENTNVGYEVIDNFAVVDDYKVKVNYLIHINEQTNFIFSFVYDTQSYAWTIELFETGESILPFVDPKTSKLSYFYTGYMVKLGDDSAYFSRTLGIMTTSDSKQDTQNLFQQYRNSIYNYQYIDTGARDIDKFHKKRFRELDLNFNNRSDKHLDFYLNYYIDNQLRQGSLSYTIEHDLNRDSDMFGTMEYIEEDEPNVSIMGENKFLNTRTEFTLDNEGFTAVDKVKVRFKISGKGYYTQYTLLSKQEEDYELLNHMWVCRPMFAR